MRTCEEYMDKLRSMKPNIHFRGELLRRDDPRLQPGINNIKLTFGGRSMEGGDGI